MSPPGADRVRAALTIAGSDSGGGAGIQADLRTFAALEVYGCSVITALTAQSTTEVRRVEPVSRAMVEAQLDTVLDDLPIRFAKTGMLHRAELVELVAATVRARGLVVVVDPVMVAESGARLLDRDAERAVLELLLPEAEVVTPNLPELTALLEAIPEFGLVPGQTLEAVEDLTRAGWALVARGARSALIKGGHRSGDPIDVFVEPGQPPLVLRAERIATSATHGTGCTYAAAITALLAHGLPRRAAVERAHAYLQGAIRAASVGPPLGRGRGPVHHLHPFYLWPTIREG